MEVLLLLQNPEGVGSLKVIDDPVITKLGPEIAATTGAAFTVTEVETLDMQLLDVTEYVIVVVPGAIPVTTPA